MCISIRNLSYFFSGSGPLLFEVQCCVCNGKNFTLCWPGKQKWPRIRVISTLDVVFDDAMAESIEREQLTMSSLRVRFPVRHRYFLSPLCCLAA